MSNAFDKASLVMLPHAYEEGKVYSLKPTDRSGDFTFSRGTDTATRVGEDGYIKKEYANLLTQSNSFDTSPWIISGFHYNNLIGNQTGYDGSSDAWLLDKATIDNQYLRHQSFLTDSVYTASIYAKANTAESVMIYVPGGYATFRLTQGGAVVSAGSNPIDTKMEDVGNGWFRCSVTGTGSQSNYYIQPKDATGAYTIGSIYIQDAQVNNGLVAYPYLETTTAPVYGGLTDDMPRLDYSDGATCPSLLLEPSRTNDIAHSEYFEGGTLSNATLSLSGTSPENINNAYALTETTVNAEHYWISEPMTTATNNNLVSTIFVKPNGRTKIRLWNYYLSNQFARVDVDLTNNTTSNGASGNVTFVSANVTNAPNGWKRVEIQSIKTASTYAYSIRVNLLDDSGNDVYTGDATKGVYIYGGQMEQNATYPTSYIPTYGSSQTRAYDNSTLLNIDTNIVDITGDFTFYLDNTGSLMKGTELYYYFIELYWDAITSIRYYSTSNGSWYYKPSNTYYGFNNSVGKQVIKYQNGVFYHFLNGTKSPSTGTMAVTNSLSKIQFFANTTGKAGYLNIKQALLFDSALSDDQCIALTTL